LTGKFVGTSDAGFWYRQKVVESIWELKRRNGSDTKEFNSRSEYDFNEFDLLIAARLFFGSWRGAKTAAGIFVNGEKKTGMDSAVPRTKLSKQRILEILYGLATAGESMQPENFVILHNHIWQTACGRTGYFSHWPSALKSAGINLNTLATEPYWTQDRLADKILELYESQLFLSTGYIRNNYHYLYRFGMRLFGGWKNAVDATKLGYENIMEEYNNTSDRQIQLQQNLFQILGRSGRDVEWLDVRKHGLAPTSEALGMFCIDNNDGTLYGTLPRSWWPNIEPKLYKLLSKNDIERIELYYIRGEPREWRDKRIKFFALTDLVPVSNQLGTDEYMRRILAMQYNVPAFL